MTVMYPYPTCTLATCSLDSSPLDYVPSLAGNLALLIIFMFLAAWQIIAIQRYQTYTYNVTLLLGSLVECLGYVARLYLHWNPYHRVMFLLQLSPLAIAPTWYTASIFMALHQIIMLYGTPLSPLSRDLLHLALTVPLILSKIFILIGATVAYTADTNTGMDGGRYTLIVGLGLQILCLQIFLTYGGVILYNIREYRKQVLTGGGIPSFGRGSGCKLRQLMTGNAFAAFLIITGTSYRIAALAGGLKKDIAGSEILFFIMDGLLVALAVTFLTLQQPGPVFGEQWTESFRKFVGKRVFEPLRIAYRF